jgi:FAD/FMN-containing dehydrogenase
VVKVQNAKQVERIVKWANETKTPLVPVSSGPPHHRGDTVPSVPEAVIVDLSGMKKILNINKQQRMAVIEPGVTYGELNEALLKEGMTISPCLRPRANKSVVGSILELEPRLNSVHQWNFTDPLRCVEVTWGDGNRMYTGEAGGSVMDLEAQWKQEKWQTDPLGPMSMDFYRFLIQAQGSMGIVTWASVRCELIQSIHKMFYVPADTEAKLLDFIFNVLHFRFSDELFILNKTQLASLIGGTPERIKALRDELPNYVALVGTAGRDLLPEMRQKQQEADIGEIAQQCGLYMLPTLCGVPANKVMERVLNPEPGADTYWKDTLKGSYQDIFFLTTIDRTAEFIDRMYELAMRHSYPTEDIGVYVQPLHLGVAYHCEFTLPYDPSNARETARLRELFEDASREFSALGAYYSRPYGPWARLQLNKDAMNYKSLEKLRDIFDPNRIMNPGKVMI